MIKDTASHPNLLDITRRSTDMPDFTGIKQIDALLAAADETTNRHGNLTRATFLESGERYLFDNALDLAQWLQFDTGSDA